MDTSRTPSADVLRRLYWVMGESSYSIAQQLNFAPSHIRRLMKKHGIPVRSPSDAHKLALKKKRCKFKKKFWISGRVKLFKKLYPYKLNSELTKIFLTSCNALRKEAHRLGVKKGINWCLPWNKGSIPWNKGLTKETDVRVAYVANKVWGKEHASQTLKNVMRGLQYRPTKPEQKLIELIEKQGFPFTYVGDGKVIIEGFCPDFIDNDGSKRIIEVFGDYWHNLPRLMRRDERRLKAYKNYGFETLVIWEHELKEPDLVTQKIRGRWL